MRPPARLFLTGAALLVAASCYSDAPVAPENAAAPVISGNPALHALATPATVDFVIPAEGGQVSILGMYTLSFPANSVCDPDAEDSQEGYASKSWDSACTPATEDVAVHATLKWSYDRLWADFAPAIRFVPGHSVTISTDILGPIVRYYGGGSGSAKKWGISYSSSIEGAVSDDSKSDRSLRTRVDANSGRITRRIKHFSGYMIAVGLTVGMPCIPVIADPNCVWVDD